MRAMLLFRSAEIRTVTDTIADRAYDGTISLRRDRVLHADVGLSRALVDLVLCYEPRWLLLGLETVFGEIVPMPVPVAAATAKPSSFSSAAPGAAAKSSRVSRALRTFVEEVRASCFHFVVCSPFVCLCVSVCVCVCLPCEKLCAYRCPGNVPPAERESLHPTTNPGMCVVEKCASYLFGCSTRTMEGVEGRDLVGERVDGIARLYLPVTRTCPPQYRSSVSSSLGTPRVWMCGLVETICLAQGRIAH